MYILIYIHICTCTRGLLCARLVCLGPSAVCHSTCARFLKSTPPLWLNLVLHLLVNSTDAASVDAHEVPDDSDSEVVMCVHIQMCDIVHIHITGSAPRSFSSLVSLPPAYCLVAFSDSVLIALNPVIPPSASGVTTTWSDRCAIFCSRVASSCLQI